MNKFEAAETLQKECGVVVTIPANPKDDNLYVHLNDGFSLCILNLVSRYINKKYQSRIIFKELYNFNNDSLGYVNELILEGKRGQYPYFMIQEIVEAIKTFSQKESDIVKIRWIYGGLNRNIPSGRHLDNKSFDKVLSSVRTH